MLFRSQAPLRLVKRCSRYLSVTDLRREQISKAVSADDVIAAKTAGRRCMCMTLNGVPLTEQWVSVEEELRYVRVFAGLGARMMHLTYNRRNMIGDGCGEPADGGLSDFGRAVVAEMNRVGVIVDVAHAGWRTSLDAARASSRPMVASHSVCGELNPHCRSKPDEVIAAIVDTGGYIGICCIPAFLGRSGDIRAFLDHIVHVVSRFGADHVAIGTDVGWNGFWSNPVFARMPRAKRPRWESLWPANDALFDPAWQQKPQIESMAWTNWPLFTVGLVQRGLSGEQIRKIIGGNVVRVLREAC